MANWRGRLGTLSAMAALCRARLLIAFVPFRRWRDSLGSPASSSYEGDSLVESQKLARHIEWAAGRLPLAIRCLPQAMALSWLLRGKGIGHSVVFAVRPAGQRDSSDALHAWVEVKSMKVLGDLPGPWLETLRLGES